MWSNPYSSKRSISLRVLLIVSCGLALHPPSLAVACQPAAPSFTADKWARGQASGGRASCGRVRPAGLRFHGGGIGQGPAGGVHDRGGSESPRTARRETAVRPPARIARTPPQSHASLLLISEYLQENAHDTPATPPRQILLRGDGELPKLRWQPGASCFQGACPIYGRVCDQGGIRVNVSESESGEAGRDAGSQGQCAPLPLATAGVWQDSAPPASKAAHCSSPPQTTVPSLALYGFLFSLLGFTPSRPPLLTDSPW